MPAAMRVRLLLLLLLAGWASGHVWAQDSSPSSSPTQSPRQLSFLVRVSLGRLRVGLFDGELDVVRAGLGVGWGKLGIIAGTGFSEVAPSAFAGDYMLQITKLPIECDLTYGLVPGRRLGQPVLYVHGEYNPTPVIYTMYGGSVSVGALWTFWAVSGGAQVSWRRSVFGHGSFDYGDFYSIGVTLDLGGWWPIHLADFRGRDRRLLSRVRARLRRD